LSAEKLAEKVGVAKTTVYRYETGSIEKIPAETIDAIAYVLRTTTGYLLGKTDEPELALSDMPAAGKTHYMSLLYGTDAYSRMLEHTAAFLKELQSNPKIALLFDRTKKLTPGQLETVLQVVNEIIGERDDV
jgi:transcriptional regulator with XRE-family HTH domain